ncbi:MAG TPA: FkbM family methyltransferase, partial [Flavobacteriaceae bacterium]|nr:FkbM family methyltransferase [Flavobacteriaceae bacterium]
MLIQLKDQSFHIDPGKNKDAWEHINTELWEPHSFDIFDFFVKKNNVIIDIGAWSGVLSLYIAHKALKVYALDPDPVCFKELETNIALNKTLAEKIKAYPIAIAEKKGMVRLSARTEYGKSSSSVLKRKRDQIYTHKIKTLSLLDFIIQEKIDKVDFIKMDVEGAEFQILPNIASALKRLKYPTLYISFHYYFLIEHLYYQYVPFVFLNKICLKLEKMTGFSVFKKKIRSEIAHLYDA